MSKRRRSNNSRLSILEATQRVAVERGANKISLDSVAKEAGLTKGGVLYNFPNKDALITGLLERLLDNYGPLIEQNVVQLQGEPQPMLRSLCRVIDQLQELDQNIPMAILAAAAENLSLLEPLRRDMASRYQQVQEEAPEPDEASLLWCAAEGLMLLDLFGLLPFDLKRKSELLKLLEDKAGEQQ